MRALRNLPFHKPLKSVLVDGPVAEGRDQRGE